MTHSVVLFDLGGVLIELTGVPRMLEWTGSTMTEEELWRRWLGSPCIRRFESGRSTVEEFAREMCEEFALPDREAFDHVVRALDTPAEKILFIDDNIVNVEGARGVGIDAHHAAGIAQTRMVLEAVGVLQNGK